MGTFALTGLFCVPLSMVLYQLAITHGQANVVAVLFSGNPIFVTLLAFLLLHETIAWNNLLALVLEVLGIGAIAGLGGGAVSLSSVALAVLAALFFAAYAVLGREFSRDLMELDNQESAGAGGVFFSFRSCLFFPFVWFPAKIQKICSYPVKSLQSWAVNLKRI